MIKICRKCESEKDLDKDFFRDSSSADGRTLRCKACRKEYADNRYKDPMVRASLIQEALRRNCKRLYGITLDDKQAMLVSQGTRCACCETDDPGKKGWVIDHDHVTKGVRGVVCNACNTILGMAKDSAENLEKAIQYLKRFQKVAGVGA
jgi:hypothetical protein